MQSEVRPWWESPLGLLKSRSQIQLEFPSPTYVDAIVVKSTLIMAEKKESIAKYKQEIQQVSSNILPVADFPTTSMVKFGW